MLFLALILVGLLALLHTRDFLGADVFRLDDYFITMLQKLFVIGLDKKEVAMLAQLADRFRKKPLTLYKEVIGQQKIPARDCRAENCL